MRNDTAMNTNTTDRKAAATFQFSSFTRSESKAWADLPQASADASSLGIAPGVVHGEIFLATSKGNLRYDLIDRVRDSEGEVHGWVYGAADLTETYPYHHLTIWND